MKTALFLIGFIFSINSIAQDVPQLPIKNDYVYYSFDHKLDNTKNCLSYYPSHTNLTFSTTLQQKMFGLSSDLCSQSNDINDVALVTLIFHERASNCSDTTSATLMLKLPTRINQSVIWGSFNAGSINATVSIIHVDKNNYNLIFKAFVCTLFGDGGTLETIDLEEFYSKFYESKKSKYDRLVLNRIDNAVRGIDKIILESFEKAYETDEL